MTPERAFQFYRAYKFYYDNRYNFEKYGWRPPKATLRHQGERRCFEALTHKLNDAAIHALFMIGFFFSPRAHISDFTTPDGLHAGLSFAGRGENGQPLLQADAYELVKRFPKDDVNGWLYAIRDSVMTQFPGCIEQLIAGELPADLACVLLLIPQPARHYNWLAYWAQQPNTGLGAHDWIARLKKLDQLLRVHRPNWRQIAHAVADEFWSAIDLPSLAPVTITKEHSLYD